MTNISERILFISSVDREKIGTSKCEDFIIKYDPPIILPQNMKHEIAVDKLSMTYSWHNIRSQYNNNVIKYSSDNGQTWNEIIFPSGMYSYNDINDYIHEIMKSNNHGDDKFDINIRFLLTTFKVAIIITNNYQLDLQNSKFGELIGFNEEIITTTIMGPKFPNITNSIDLIHINSNIINDSIMSGKKSNTLFVIPTNNLRRSYPFLIEPNRALFNTISTNIISRMRFNITDAIGRPINLNNIDWYMNLILKSTPILIPEFYEGNNSNRSRKRKAKTQNEARCLSFVVCRVQTTRDTSDT